MQLTSENYYSQEANQEYMSVSGYKDFAGTYGKMPCEFYGMEKLNGRWEDEKSTALLVGSYVDSYFEGSLEQFKKDNPEIFTQKGKYAGRDTARCYQVGERLGPCGNI